MTPRDYALRALLAIIIGAFAGIFYSTLAMALVPSTRHSDFDARLARHQRIFNNRTVYSVCVIATVVAFFFLGAS